MNAPTMSIKELVIATRDVTAAAKLWADSLGVAPDDTVSYPQAGIEIDMSGVWLGNFHIAFVSDSSGKGPVSRFLEKRGEGLFELCVQTDNLQQAAAQMKGAGFKFATEKVHVLRNYRFGGDVFSEVHVLFVHPSSATGTQIELQEWHK